MESEDDKRIRRKLDDLRASARRERTDASSRLVSLYCIVVIMMVLAVNCFPLFVIVLGVLVAFGMHESHVTMDAILKMDAEDKAGRHHVDKR